MQEREIFTAVRQVHDHVERNALLDQACGGDRDLRRRVLDLIEEEAQLGSFLEHGDAPAPTIVGPPVEPSAAAERPAGVIGPYKLIQEIGEGGMGTVWMAQQTEPVKRLVALKLNKAGMDSRQVIARFEAERQALALMDHGNIARVLDAGTTSFGRPYFVMELVKGVSITKYCDEQRLTPRQRLELFIPVCQAVQHAHQKGVIHRDLKPSNVLVALYDGRPVPKVIDFGVAKAAGQSLTDKTLVTGFGTIVGTLEYMSPEQAETNQLDIDTRSDIYSLGVLLYELLAGTPPFTRKELEKAGVLEMLRLIREQEPTKPSTKLSSSDALPSLSANRGTEPAKLTKLLRGELDWIVMKALEKDRGRRYETANGLAQDLKRYLADEPVLACPPSTGYRLRKFIRRNKGPVIAAALVVATLVAGIIGTTWGLVEAESQRRLADRNFHEAERAARENSELAQKNETLAGEKAQEAIRATEAKNDAVAARRKAEITLTDMHTSRGLLAAERQDPAEAVLWFANAARLARTDVQREWASLVRTRSWGRQVVTPIRVLPHHGQPLKFIEFRPGGEHLLAMTLQGRCHVWDRRQEESLPWARGEHAVLSACWNPEGSWLAWGLPSGKLEIREIPSGNVLHQIDHGEPVTALAFSPCGHWLAVAGTILRLWDCRKQEYAATEFKHPQAVHSLVFNGKGDRFATACLDRHARVFGLSSETSPLAPLFPAIPHMPGEGYTRPSTPPAFVDEGRGLITVTGPIELTWWDALTGKPAGPGKMTSKVRAGIPGVVASPDGRSFVFGSWGLERRNSATPDGAQVWSVGQSDSAGKLLAHEHMVNGYAYSPDGKRLLTVSWDRKARLWSMPEGKPVGYAISHLDVVDNAAFSPDGRLLATGERKGIVRVWRLPAERNSKPTLSLGVAHLRLKSSRDGRRAIPGRFLTQWNPIDTIPRIQVLEVASGRPAGPELHVTGKCVDASLSSDGRQAAAVVNLGVAGSLHVWNVETGKPSFAPIPLAGNPLSVAFSSDDSRLAVLCQNGRVLVVSPSEGRTLCQFTPEGWRLTNERGAVLDFIPEADTLIINSGASVYVCDAGSGESRYSPICPPDVRSKFINFVISGDGAHLATESLGSNSSLQVWNLATGKAAAAPLPQPENLFQFCFSRDGRRLFTACRDGQARLWDWDSRKLVCPPTNLGREFWSVALSPDGHWGLTPFAGHSLNDGDIQAVEFITGKPLTPGLGVKTSPLSFVLSADGTRAVVHSNSEGTVDSVDLSDLTSAGRRGVDDLCTLAELASGQRIHEGELAGLTSEECLARWRDFRKRHPDYDGDDALDAAR